MTSALKVAIDGGPYALAAGPDGALWVTLVHGGAIARVATDGDVRVFPVAPDCRPSIITAGTDMSGARAAKRPSLYPGGIPIGTVKRMETGEGELDRVIHVAPVAPLRDLDIVEVLTQPSNALRAEAP